MSLAILKTLFAQKTWANAEVFDAMHLVDTVQHAEPLHTAIGMAPPRDLLTKFLHQREPARRQPA